MEQADDIKSEFKDWHNKEYFAHFCSKKYQECQRKKSQQQLQSTQSPDHEKSEKERYAKIIVSIMFKWLFTFKMNLL